MDNDVPKFDLLDYRTFAAPIYTNAIKTESGTYINGYGMISDPDKWGFALKTSDTNFRIMVGNEFEPFLYRGENSSHTYFKPSFQRINNEIEKCIAWIRKEQFKSSFMKTPYYERISKITVMGYKFDFDLEALAQHFGFKTNYLDITKKRDVAEFFAYTYIDENGQYKPIDDFKKYKPHLYRAKISDVINYNSEIFQIVGFQVTGRTFQQQAMALDLSTNYKTIKKDLFETELLEESTERAIEIYEKFEGGKTLFPEEVLITLKDELEKKETIVTERLLWQYAKISGISYYKLKTMLRHRGYKIKPKELYPSIDLINNINNHIDIELKPFIDKGICHRLFSRISAEEC